MRRSRHRLTGLLLGLALLAGCASPPELELAFETEHFRYYVETSRPRCAAVTAWLEHYALSLERLFGISPGKIDYALYADTSSLAEAGCDSLGCARGTNVQSVFPVHVHELVHVYAEPLGRPPRAFAEGLASVLGCTSEQQAPTAAPIEEILTTSGFARWPAAGAYATSASFVRHLLDRYGMDRFLAFYARAGEHATLDELRTEFTRAFETSLDDELEAWRADPPARICDWQMECSMMNIAPDREIGIELLCGKTGPPAELAFRAEMEREGVLQLELDGTATHGVTIHRCDGGLVHEAAFTTEPNHQISVDAGDYLIRVRGSEAQAHYKLRWLPFHPEKQ